MSRFWGRCEEGTRGHCLRPKDEDRRHPDAAPVHMLAVMQVFVVMAGRIEALSEGTR